MNKLHDIEAALAILVFGDERLRLTELWPAPGSEDTKFGVTMGPEDGHAEAEVYAGVQA